MRTSRCLNDVTNTSTRTHLQDLIETTALIHYEAFRSKQLLALKEGVNARPAADRPQ